MVNVISTEFEKVLVEQNHCQGLNIVMKSWYGQQTSQVVKDCSTDDCRSRLAAYSIHPLGKLPCIIVSHGSKNPLNNIGENRQDHCSELWETAHEGHKTVGNIIHNCK